MGGARVSQTFYILIESGLRVGFTWNTIVETLELSGLCMGRLARIEGTDCAHFSILSLLTSDSSSYFVRLAPVIIVVKYLPYLHDRTRIFSILIVHQDLTGRASNNNIPHFSDKSFILMNSRREYSLTAAATTESPNGFRFA